MDEQNQTPLFALKPKTMFLLGGIAGFLVLSTIGFFILLGVMLSGGNSDNTGDAPSRPTSGAQPTAPSNSGTTGDIQLTLAADDWYRGAKNAKITIVEFSDLECPFCQRFHPTMQQVIAEYGDRVKWVYRHFPLTSLHSKAPKEAEATECAGELGGNDGFWAFVDRLFTVTPANNGLDPAQLPEIAEYVGLNRAKFQTCLDSGKYAGKVQEQANQAVAAGGNGTPYSVIVTSDQKIPVSGAVPFEQLKSILDALL